MEPNPTVDLATIGNGAAFELFSHELNRILANIKDPNTSPEKKRKLSLIFEFSPFNDRSGAAIEIKVKGELCATTGVNATLHIRRISGGGYEAVTQDVRQNRLNFDATGDEEEPSARPGAKPQ